MGNQQQPCVLAVIADGTLASQVQVDLQNAGYLTVLATEVHQARHCLASRSTALIVIDTANWQTAGVELCQDLRQQGDRTPILFLAANDSLSNRVACLEAGADDYVSLPYRSERFIEQVSFYLQVPEQPTEELQFGDLRLEVNTRRAVRGSRMFDLTVKEFELLRYLMLHPLQVVTREQILENVWGYEFGGESNVIEVYIRYLRLKIEDEGEKRLIQTVRGVGYVLRET